MPSSFKRRPAARSKKPAAGVKVSYIISAVDDSPKSVMIFPMDLPTLAKEATRKGIQLLVTDDCLHPKWLNGIRELEERNGIFYFKEAVQQFKIGPKKKGG